MSGEPPVRLALSGRTLLLVAGMPGAGKSTLLADLPAHPEVVAVDSETYRASFRRLLPSWLRYAAYRPLVHLVHRVAVVRAAFSRASTVVVHLPATDPTTRAAVARLAAVTGRAAHLLWLHVEPDEARRGQHVRGRVVPSRSFTKHARQAAATMAELLGDRHPDGWRCITVVNRARAASGLRLDVGPAEQTVGLHK
jgi:predicted kinase